MADDRSRIGTKKKLSCTSCRQRKIKCNRATPCDPCLEAAIECVYPSRRARPTRAQREAIKARDEDLLGRIRHLESLLASKPEVIRGGENVDSAFKSTDLPMPSSAVTTTPAPSSGMSGNIEPGVALDDQYSNFIQQQKSSSRHINIEFWSSLSDEFDSLKQLLDTPADEDETESMSTDVTSDIVLQESESSKEIAHPPHAHSVVLWQFYFKNVDPLCKILHRPTVNAYFTNIKTLFEPGTGRFKFKSLEAVTFAAYFAAVTSMTSEECTDYFGEDRGDLLGRFGSFTERLLVQSDYLNTLEMTTLQALVIYTITRRAHNRGRSNWALAGLALRTAQGLGLHRDGDGRSFSAFEAELRRRLFWQILSLDMRSAEDRGMEPVLAERNIRTTMPNNLSDEDFGYDSQHPLQGKLGHTDMTYSLLEMDALYTLSRLTATGLTLKEREELIRKYVERVNTTYLANCDFGDPRMKFLGTLGSIWVDRLWLGYHYPLHHRREAQRVVSSAQGLELATSRLRNIEQIAHDPFCAGFAWLFGTYAPWHSIAVALTEICNRPQGSTADVALEIIQGRFKDWNNKVPDTKEAMVWSPIRNMLRHALVTRQNAREAQPAVHQIPASSNIPMELQTLQENSAAAQQIAQATQLPLQAVTQQNEIAFPPLDSVMDHSAVPADFSNSFDYWGNFTFDINALGEDNSPEMSLFGIDQSNALMPS